jgi:hypothetical protein
MDLPDDIGELEIPEPNLLAQCTLDEFVLKKEMLPQYVSFVKETDKRGCKFEIALPNQKRISTSGSKKVSLKCKYNEMIQIVRDINSQLDY